MSRLRSVFDRLVANPSSRECLEDAAAATEAEVLDDPSYWAAVEAGNEAVMLALMAETPAETRSHIDDLREHDARRRSCRYDEDPS